MMKKLCTLLLLILFVVMAGCSPTEKITGKTGDVTDVTGKSSPVITDTNNPELKRVEIVVYRKKKNGEMNLVPEKVKYAMGKKTPAEAALDALVNTDPVAKTLTNLFPSGTKIRSVTVKGDTARVDFNQAFAAKGQGSYGEYMMVNAVVCTLTEIPEIKKVKFLVDGKDIDTISGHMDLTEPLTRNPDVLKKK